VHGLFLFVSFLKFRGSEGMRNMEGRGIKPRSPRSPLTLSRRSEPVLEMLGVVGGGMLVQLGSATGIKHGGSSTVFPPDGLDIERICVKSSFGISANLLKGQSKSINLKDLIEKSEI